MNILSLQCLGESRKRNDILSIILHPREEKASLSAEASCLSALLLQSIPVVPSSARSKADLKAFPHLDRSSRTSSPSFSSWLLAASSLPPMLAIALTAQPPLWLQHLWSTSVGIIGSGAWD